MPERKENELYITRIYDAPLKLVWDAWTDVNQVSKWWGPRGFTLTSHSKDLRTGGHWEYTMHGPDGTDYPNVTKYLEVIEYEKLVYDHGGTKDSPPLFRVTVTFKEIAGKTKMEMIMSLSSKEAAENTKKFIKEVGGNSTWDRLAEYLEIKHNNKEKFVINRTFDAPIDLLFKLWTDPLHFSKWVAPKGFSTSFIRSEIKEGATTFYKMSDGDKVTMYGRASYIKVNPPYELVYTQQFCDEQENISRHPFAPIWPETMLTKVTFSEEDKNLTRVTVEWEPYGEVSSQELDCFVNARFGMTIGWTGSFDKLESLISELR